MNFIKPILVISISTLLTACGGESSNNPSTPPSSNLLTSGYKSTCFIGSENKSSVIDVFRFNTDNTLTYQMWVYENSTNCTGAVRDEYETLSKHFIFNFNVVSTNNTDSPPTQIWKLQTGNILGNSLLGDPTYLRAQKTPERICFGIDEGRYRSHNIDDLPSQGGAPALLTLYGKESPSAVSDTIYVSTYDHCLTAF